MDLKNKFQVQSVHITEIWCSKLKDELWAERWSVEARRKSTE